MYSIKRKILSLFTLTSYLMLLVVSVVHIHHYSFNNCNTCLINENPSKEVDPFAGSDSVCGITVFAQTAYLGSSPDILSNTTQYFSLNKYFFFATYFESFTGLHKNLRAPPVV